jgi:hypothetical protein
LLPALKRRLLGISHQQPTREKAASDGGLSCYAVSFVGLFVEGSRICRHRVAYPNFAFR